MIAARLLVGRLRRWRWSRAIAVLLLAGAIAGASTMAMTASAILRTTAPYKAPSEVFIVELAPDRDMAATSASGFVPYESLASWSPIGAAVAGAGFHAAATSVLNSGRGPELVESAAVAGDWFGVLDGAVTIGRPLTVADDGSPNMVVAASLARRLCTPVSACLGRAIEVDGRSWTIVGVSHERFALPATATQVWVPATTVRSTNPRCCVFTPVVRIREDSRQSGVEQITAAIRTLERQWPSTMANRRVSVRGVDDWRLADALPALRLLVIGAVAVLLLVCCSVVVILAAQDVARRQSHGAVFALGLPPRTMSLVTIGEAAAMVTAAGGFAVVLSHRLLRLAAPITDAGLQAPVPLTFDSRWVGAATGAALVVIAVGVLIAGVARDQMRRDAMGRSRGAGLPSRAWMRGVCVLQVGIATSMVVAALSSVLLTRDQLNMVANLTTTQVVSASVRLSPGASGSEPTEGPAATRIIDGIRVSGNVESVALATARPPDGNRVAVRVTGEDQFGHGPDREVALVSVTPDYFRTLSIEVVAGRTFADHDRAGGQEVAVVGVSAARLLFGDGEAVGRRFDLPMPFQGAGKKRGLVVVGVVDDVRYTGVAGPPTLAVYRPFAQQPWRAAYLFVKTRETVANVDQWLRRSVQVVDDTAVLWDVKPLDQHMEAVLGPATQRARIASTFAVATSLLACVGIWAVIVDVTSQRRREIAVRIAVGATRTEIARGLVAEWRRLAVAGALAGVFASWVTHVLMSGTPEGWLSAELWVAIGAAVLALAGGFVAATLAAGRQAERTVSAVLASGD